MTSAAFFRALAIVLLAAPAVAAPQDMPPADWPGAVWVDSAGCAFQRAEIGETTVWADRLDAQGAPLCGFPPSAGVTGTDAVTAVSPQRRGQPPPFPQPGRYAQVAAFRAPDEADALATELHLRGLRVLRQDFRRGGLRVLHTGPLGDADAAAAQLAGLRAMGYGDAFLWVVE